MNGAWPSLVALGKAYENMAKTLRTGDTPYYLTEDQLEIYSMQIEDKAYVQEEKAVNAFKLALDKSFELTLYNENTAIRDAPPRVSFAPMTTKALPRNPARARAGPRRRPARV